MDDFLVAGPADNPEEAIALMRATAIASFGEAVREIARQNFAFCNVHRRAVPLPATTEPDTAAKPAVPDPQACICPPDVGDESMDLGASGPLARE
jgi:hypothetical protein